jgi:DNA polymerase I-like protein with 3'-5' exonuclease and polymerase domains
MSQKLTIIDTLEDLVDLQLQLEDEELASFDTETTGLTRYDSIIGYSIAFNEIQGFYVILAKYDKNTQKLQHNEELIKYSKDVIMPLLAQKSLVMHNSVFDCMMVEAYFKVRLIDALLADTMIMAHLLDENRRVGLKELAKAILGEHEGDEQKLMKESVQANGGKLTKLHYEMYKCDSQIMARYGAKDAILTYRLFMHFMPQLEEEGLSDFFFRDESMPLLKGPTYEMNTTGLSIDEQALKTLELTLTAECAEAKSFIFQEILPYIQDKYPGTNKKNQFNIGSSSQLAWLLFEELVLEFNTLTDAGKQVCKDLGLKLPYTYAAKREFIAVCHQQAGQTHQPEVTVNGKIKKAKKIREPWFYIAADKKTLTKLAPKYKWIAKLLEYQRKQKLLNTYIKGMQSRIQYGVIRPNFLQHGTTSGRYASRNPNFQNLPRDDERIKQCVIARPGKVFVSADQSQLEPRVFASYSQDKRLMDAFDGTTDFYSVVGMEVYDKFDCTPQKEGSPDAFGVKYKKYRDLAKTIALAAAYGATPYQLAPTTGKSVEDTAEDLNKYLESFPGVKTMMLEAHDLAKKDGYVTSLFGRPRRIPDAKKIEKLYGNQEHAELPYEARSILNLACNHRIQSTGASIMNRSAIRFYDYMESMELDARIILQVHDELVVECNEADAEQVSQLLQDALENTVELPGVPLQAIPRISKTLAKK